MKTLFVLMLGTMTMVAAFAAPRLKVVAPDAGLYHGAYPDFGPTAGAATRGAIEEFENLAQRKIVWAYFSDHWFDGIHFPQKQISEIDAAGRIPYIRMMPWSEDNENKREKVYTLHNILSGVFDAQLTAYARSVEAFGQALMIEFGPEVNGDWFPWNGRWNGGGTMDQFGDSLWPDGPERYRQAYRRIINIFRREGALNVTWVFHVDSQRSPHEWWNDAKYYYPGDDFIDWIGISVFGAQLPDHTWKSFSTTLDAFYPQAIAVSKTKPILIAETAVIEMPLLGNKPQWITNMFAALTSGKYPRIKGVSYWNSPGWLPNKKANFRIDSSPEALEAYRQGVARPQIIDEPIIGN